MAELIARPAWEGLDLPLTRGRCTLAPAPQADLASVAPFRGREAEVGRVLGADLPAPGAWVQLGEGRILWTGIGQWFVQGPPAPGLGDALGGRAAVTDQSDAWAALRLSGADAADVLARLVPVDLDPAAFPAGRVARTMLRHVLCVLIATREGIDVLVMRSFAQTAAQDLEEAMRAVAGRAALARD